VRTIYIQHDGSAYLRGEERTDFPDLSDPDRFVLTAQTVTAGTIGSPDYFGAAAFDPDGTLWYFDYRDDFARRTLNLNTAGTPIGASFHPVDDALSDLLHVLYRTAPGQYSEQKWKTAPATALASDAVFRSGPLPGLPDEMHNAFYHYCPATGRSYVSWYDPERREYRNFWWDGTLALHVMDSPGRRIEQVLSNGWLYSRGENLGYLYDPDGRFLNQFVLGGLELVYEIHVATVPFAVFTMAAWAPAPKEDNPRLWFLVYVLPTDELADL